MLRDFYTEKILEETYTFCEDGKKYNYFAPPETDMEGYIQFLTEKMPPTDVPQIFGLHSNAEISSALMEKNGLLKTVLNILPRTGKQIIAFSFY